MVIGADRTGKPSLRCSLLLHSSLTLLPGQWDRRQSCKYTLGATFVIISQNVLIARYKSFGHATIARHNIKHVLWHFTHGQACGLFTCNLHWLDSISFFNSMINIFIFRCVDLKTLDYYNYFADRPTQYNPPNCPYNR